MHTRGITGFTHDADFLAFGYLLANAYTNRRKVRIPRHITVTVRYFNEVSISPVAPGKNYFPVVGRHDRTIGHTGYIDRWMRLPRRIPYPLVM